MSSTVHHTTNQKPTSIGRWRLFFYLFALIIAGFAIYYFGEIRHGLRELVTVQPAWLIVAILSQGTTYFVNAVLFQGLLKKIAPGVIFRLTELIRTGVVTLFINLTLPSAQISGNIFFYNYLRRRGVSRQAAYTTMLFELLIYYIASLTVILLLMFLFVIIPGMPRYFIIILLIGLFAYLLFTFGVGILGRGKTAERLVTNLAKVKWLRKFALQLKRIPFSNIRNPLRTFREHQRLAGIVLLLQLGYIAADTMTLYALLSGLGSPLSFPSVLMGLMLTRIISLIPFLPGALILYEGSLTLFYFQLGTPLPIAVVVTLLYRLLSFWFPIPAGFLLYKRTQRSVTTTGA